MLTYSCTETKWGNCHIR